MITGVFSGVDKNALLSMLQAKKYFILETRSFRRIRKNANSSFQPKYRCSSFCFLHPVSTVLRAGVPIAQALEILRSQTSNKKLSRVIGDINQKIQEGKTITEAFGEHSERFPRLLLSMIESGEVSGSLDGAFQRMGESFTKEYKLNQKVKSVMIYPTILSLVAVCVVTFLLIFIVPTFTDLYASSGIELPILTKMLLGLSSFMASNILLILMSLAFIAVAFNLYIKSTLGRLNLDRIKATMPVVGKLLNSVYSARFTRSMATLTSTGVSLPNALEVTASNLSNSYAAQKMKKVIDDVNKGRGLSVPLIEMNFFPPMVVQMCRLGEEAGTLENLLSQAADFYENESDMAMGRLASLLEPCIIVLLGGAGAFHRPCHTHADVRHVFHGCLDLLLYESCPGRF